MDALSTIGEEVFVEKTSVEPALQWENSLSYLLQSAARLIPSILWPSDTSKSHAFSTDKLKKVMIEILDKHGYAADTKLIGKLPENQCKV
jgi:hypothetical protein